VNDNATNDGYVVMGSMMNGAEAWRRHGHDRDPDVTGGP